MINAPISSGTRLVSMLLDHIFMTIIVMLFMLPIMYQQFSNDKITFPTNPWIFTMGFALYFCKDCINGKSIAKRILKLQVIDKSNNLPATPFQCFVRNIFCVIWPIEIIVTLRNPNRRIGDVVANTMVIPFTEITNKEPLNWAQIIGSYILAFLFSVAIYFLTLSI